MLRLSRTSKIVLGIIVAIILAFMYIPLMLVVITVRNGLYLVVLGWAIHAIVTAPSAAEVDEDPDGEWLPSVLPGRRKG